MKKFLVLSVIFIVVIQKVNAQGCIIVRNISGLGHFDLASNSFSPTDWELSINNRYFEAYRDYKGKADQHTPPQNQNIIKSFSTDFEITKLFKKGLSINLGFPISVNTRYTNLEHGGPNTPKYRTQAFGVGDIHAVAYIWLFKPSDRGNIQLGLGIKFPTGDYRKQGYFYRNDTTRVLSLLNPSIQLGDGGTGIITELNTFYFLDSRRRLNLYGNFYYLINPTDINGTQYTQGRPQVPLLTQLGAYDVSVPDVFSLRGGITYNLKHWAFSAGLRYEGAPVHDLIGESNGIRRSGYTLSAEPGIIYRFKRITVYTYVPFLLSHEIKQNELDRAIQNKTGVYTLGAGGSGDYQIFLGAQFQL